VLPGLFSLLLQRDDSGKWVELVMVLLFLLAGAVRAIYSAVQARLKNAPGRGPELPRHGQGSGAESAPEGLDRWEALLRGEAPPARAPRPVPRRESPPPERTLPMEGALVFPSVDLLPPGSREATLERRWATEDLPDEEELERTGADLEASPSALTAGEIGSAGEARAAGPSWPGGVREANWRRAVITAELLGPPLALHLRPPGPLTH
jgi:hypothetical protein